MNARRGFTLIEILLALALMSMMVLGLVRLLDTSLDLWGKTESERDVLEMGGDLLELIARDLSTLEGSEEGDLVFDWVKRDADKNGVSDLLVPRLIARRQADAAELARAGSGHTADPWAVGLIEVCWILSPAGGSDPDRRNIGVLSRGERLANFDDGELSFFDPKFFTASGAPRPGTVRELSGGVLWFQATFASPTSILHNGWSIGDGLGDCSTAWDAWGRGRPSLEISDWNTPAAGAPITAETPALPRRVRIELELERPQDLKRRPRLVDSIDGEERELRVTHADRVPLKDTYVLLEEEWMLVLSRGSNTLQVKRGQRGTRAQAHDGNGLLHFGRRLVRDIPIAQGRGDW